MSFDFSHFPEEEEIVEDVHRILVEQYESGVILELAEKIEKYNMSGVDRGEMSMNMDIIGAELFDAVGREAVRLPDLPESAREAIAILWVNYMCDKPHGEIVEMIGNLMCKGVNYKKVAMQSLSFGKSGNVTQEMHDGSLVYLWTMTCLIRALKRAIDNNTEEIGKVPAPHLYMGASLN